MGLGLPIYGVLVGFFCATYCFVSGQVGILGALALYSGTGVLFVVSGALLMAFRSENAVGEDSQGAISPVAIHR